MRVWIWEGGRDRETRKLLMLESRVGLGWNAWGMGLVVDGEQAGEKRGGGSQNLHTRK